MSARTAPVISRSVADLLRNPAAPASRAASRYSSSWTVKTRTRVADPSAVMALIAWIPSIPGTPGSMITMSGFRARTRSTASSPEDASPTTSTRSMDSRTALRPARTTLWSSASSTFTTVRNSSFAPIPHSPRPRSGPIDGSLFR